MQDELYKPNYYLSMYEFRDLTLRRLQLFVSQRFFSVFDYLHGAYWEGLRNNSCLREGSDWSVLIASQYHTSLQRACLRRPPAFYGRPGDIGVGGLQPLY